MDERLTKLLQQISLSEESIEYFDNGKLVKIVGNKNKDCYTFFVELENHLPVEVFNEFINKLHTGFPTVKTVIGDIKVTNINNDLASDYFTYLMDRYSKKCPILQTFTDTIVSIDDYVLNLEVANIAEKNKLESLKKEILKDCSYYGYKDLKLNVFINEEKGKEIRDSIEEEKNKRSVITPDRLEKIDEVPPQDNTPYKKQYVRKQIETEDHPSVIYGRLIDTEVSRIDTIVGVNNHISIEGEIFGLDFRETKTDLVILTLKITDYTDSIYGKMFINNKEELARIKSALKVGTWYKFRGPVKEDKYSGEDVLNVYDINVSDREANVSEIDDASIKRVELHTHTMMSQMDGLVDAKKLVKTAYKWGHKAIAITDHNGCQAFPDVYHFVCDVNKELKEGEEPFKAIYGTELVMIDDTIRIVVRPNDTKLLENTYVVFDLETTGFNAGGGDSIIEIGAVKIYNGEIIDRFDELINPGHKLNPRITEVTSITDEMLADKDIEENAVKRFKEWIGDYPTVAHNAKFDTSFMEMAYSKYNLGTFTNCVIDTLELSRTLDTNFARHSLSALVKRYNVPFDEESHHRGDYDAEATALVFHKMLLKLESRNFEKISDLDSLVSKDEIHKYGRAHHINILVLNKTGLKNLFKIISFANTKYLYKTPRILRSEVEKYREGLLIGSGCYESEVFTEAKSKSDEELTNIINFYDYVEVQPPEVYDHMIQSGDFANQNELLENIKKVVKVTTDSGKMIVATGDVHHLRREDKMYREIIVNQKVPGGGRHPLARSNIESIPSQHLRTTREMLNDFEFLGIDKAYEIVVTNTNKIADMVEIIEVIIETGGVPFSPKIENSVDTVNELVYGRAKDWYGDPLPDLIKERIEQELKGIIGGGFDVIYLIAQKLVKKSNEDGYLVGSRGSVGSSFVATMMGITEVNPLPAHYRCLKCKHSIFEDDTGKALGATYSSGFDLPDLICPKCGEAMYKDGQDMPFATFLGFNADKVPDIDLNFSDLNQAAAHEYTKVLFGEDNVYRAGTIGTVADKTAFGYVKGYCEDHNLVMRTAEIERRAMGCTGVKRTTGQHPGGIVVIPGYMDVFDFTPFQYPADDVTASWRTTHFDYHAIDQDVLKLDILGHSDPTQLRMLQDLSGMDVTTVPLDDRETMSIFLSPAPLGVTKDQIMCETGTLGVPEFGTPFTIGMLVDTKPKTFSELIKISGLSHGTDVWLGNAQELIKKNIVPFKEVIGCRDDIMVYLMYNGLEPIKAFKIMEFVRKGKASKDPVTWQGYVDTMKEANIPDWFIDSCGKIKYMFPKAHAAAYVISAFRIAWFKVHKPVLYYATYFSARITDYDIDVMIKGYQSIKDKIVEITNKGYEATNKESAVLETLKIALEATARGIKFAPINLLKSAATTFTVIDDNSMYPPFSSIDGLGDTVAKNIVEEREKSPFLSVEDVQRRAKVSGTLIEKMRLMGIFDGMEESNQMSLF